MKRLYHLDSFRIFTKPKFYSGLRQLIPKFKLPLSLFYFLRIPAVPRLWLAGLLFTFRALCGPALLLSGITFDIYSQQPTEEWARIYNSQDNTADHFIDMVIDRFGNVYITGWTLTQSQRNNINTVKYSGNGNLLWASSYNGINDPIDIPIGMAVDSSGNCYVAGYSGFNFGPYNGILIKYSPLGDTLWTRKLITVLDDEFNSIAIDRNNYVCVTARSGDTALVFKFDPNGGIVWRAKYFEPTYFTLPGKIKIDDENKIYIGSTKHILSSLTSGDFLVRSYNVSGTELWATTYNSPFNMFDLMRDFTIDNSGNCYAVGAAAAASSNDILTLKINNLGQFQWAKFYNGPTNSEDQGYAVVCDTDGTNVYITGHTFRTGASVDYITIKYNSQGDSLWTRTYNGPGNFQDRAFDIALDKNANVYITGESSTISFDFDIATIKYNSDGIQQWVTRWKTPGDGGDRGFKVIVDESFSVYIGGEAAAPSPNFLDLLAIKYSQTVGIIQNTGEVPGSFQLFQNYPNPFNPETRIKFHNSRHEMVTLRIYDIYGREIETIVNERLSPGVYEINWNASKYASGIYLYSIVTNDQKITKKMMLVK